MGRGPTQHSTPLSSPLGDSNSLRKCFISRLAGFSNGGPLSTATTVLAGKFQPCPALLPALLHALLPCCMHCCCTAAALLHALLPCCCVPCPTALHCCPAAACSAAVCPALLLLRALLLTVCCFVVPPCAWAGGQHLRGVRSAPMELAPLTEPAQILRQAAQTSNFSLIPVHWLFSTHDIIRALVN